MTPREAIAVQQRRHHLPAGWGSTFRNPLLWPSQMLMEREQTDEEILADIAADIPRGAPQNRVLAFLEALADRGFWCPNNRQIAAALEIQPDEVSNALWTMTTTSVIQVERSNNASPACWWRRSMRIIKSGKVVREKGEP